MDTKTCLMKLYNYPSLLVSGIADGALKLIEDMENEIETLKKQLSNTASETSDE